MNERQSNAVKQMQNTLNAIADSMLMARPDLSYWHRKNEAETTVILERLEAFLSDLELLVVSGVPQASEGPENGSDVLTAASRATVEELAQLPYVGKATAQKILAALHGSDV